jgi:hypothetical protein
MTMKIDWDSLHGLDWAWMTDCGLWKATKNEPEFMEGHGFYDPEGPDDTELIGCKRVDDGSRAWNYQYAYDYKDTLVQRPNQPPEPKDVVYIAGPMRGYQRNNIDAFNAAEERLKDAGYGVINPITLDKEYDYNPDGTEDPTEWFLWVARGRDINLINDHATHIYMLDGWEESVGATAEYYLAKWAGLTIIKEGDKL